MNNRLTRSTTIVAALVVLWLGQILVAAQQRGEPPSVPAVGQPPQTGGARGGGGRGGRSGAAAPAAGPVARLSDGKPDMNGYWSGGPPGALANIEGGRGGSPIVDPPEGKIPYQPGWRERADQNQTRMYDEPELHCFMSGVPSQLWRQFGFQIVQIPGWVVTINEFMGSVRMIPTDSRPHISDKIKLFNGDSVGRWEGDTLIVDTTSNNDRTWLDNYGNIHSDALHVVERFTAVDANTINYEATLEDPKAYTRPWTVRGTFRRNTTPGYEQMEFACVEGNRDKERYPESTGGPAKEVPPEKRPTGAAIKQP